MPKVRTYDSGLAAPKSGKVLPVGSRWAATCYKCGQVADGVSRKEAIENHVEHYESEHHD